MLVLDPRRMQQLEVVRSKSPLAMAIILVVILVPVGGGSFISGIRGGGLFSIVLGGGLLAALVFILAAMYYARYRSVKMFSSSGILLGDGTEVPWNGLLRVTDRVGTKNGSEVIWRTDLEFSDGRKAWLNPNGIANFDDVYAFVKSLDCTQNEKISPFGYNDNF